MRSAFQVQRKFRKLADPEKAILCQRFFKTGKGQYGEGDCFLGIPMPEIRKFATACAGLPLTEILKILKSRWHEERLLAVLLLMFCFQRAAARDREKIFNSYLRSTRFINNWDLIDITAPHVVGAYLQDRPRQVLYQLAKSDSLWERRIAILATFHFIRQGDYADTLKISKALLNDPHDLIHKAVGWLLREVGKRDLKTAEAFLQKHSRRMPRTMLRYAIEKFSAVKRKFYLR